MLTRAEHSSLLRHLDFVEVERFGDWVRYRAGRAGVQSLVVDMSREQYILEDILDDIERVGIPREDVMEAYRFMKGCA